MEAPTGNSPATPSLNAIVPLRSVLFTHPVPVEGFKTMCTQVESGGARMDDGSQKQFPQVYMHPGLRTVVIAGRHYPFERVVSFERAKAAMSKLPGLPDIPNYTIGKQRP